MNTIKDKSLPLNDVSNPIWYLQRSDRKSSSITSSALSSIVISMLSLLGCIRCSSLLSLEGIKLIAIAD